MNKLVLLLGAMCLALAGCGGGGESASPTPPGGSAPPGGSPPATARVTFNHTTLSLTNVSGGGPTDNSITFNLTNYTGTLWYRYRQTGVIVEDLTVSNRAGADFTTNGSVFIRLMDPTRLGAGTYTSNVTLDLCNDQACTAPFSGTPIEIPVTYVVTGSALPATRVGYVPSVPYGLLEYEAKVTQQPTFEVRADIADVPALSPVYFLRGTSQTGLITGVDFTPPPSGTPAREAHVTWVVRLKSPAALGSGIFTDSLTLRVCLDANCVNEVPGSPFELKPVITVVASEGIDIARVSRAPDQGAQAIAWSQSTQRLYVLSSDQDAVVGPTAPADVLALDPATLQTTASATLNTGWLDKVAVASDGNGLFVSSLWTPYLHHLQLPTLTKNYTIDLGLLPGGEPIAVRSMLPLSGQPQSMLLSLHSGGLAAGIKVYDGTVPRAVDIAPGAPDELATPVVQGATSSSFFGLRQVNLSPTQSIDQLSVAAGGVTRTMAVTTTLPPSNVERNIQYAGGFLYDELGNVMDPSTGSVVRRLVLPDEFELQNLVVDGAHNRLLAQVVRRGFFVSPYVMSFALADLKLLAVARLTDGTYEVFPGNRHMILWGNNGLAISDGHRIVVVSGKFFTD